MCCVVICCLSKKYLKSVHTSIILVNKNGICMDQNIFFFLKMSLTYGKFYLSILKNTRRLRVVWGLGGRVAGWPVNKEKPIMTHGSRLCGCLWFRWIFFVFYTNKRRRMRRWRIFDNCFKYTTISLSWLCPRRYFRNNNTYFLTKW